MFADVDESLKFLPTVIVPDFISSAWEIDSDPFNLGRKVIKLIVKALVEMSTNDEVDRVIESLNTLDFMPVSRSSIQALKRAKWGGEGHLPFKKSSILLESLSSKKECSICLDEFSKGDEVASMTCGHVYHDGCIVKWLETSHLCPLCWYQMPS
ncbi:hypothetical protein CRYUN_Cryun20dG0030700 [Craigia yunnanensis]